MSSPTAGDPTGTPTMAPPGTTPIAATPQQDNDDDASDAVETATKGEKSRFLPRVKVLLSKDHEAVSFVLLG